MSQEAGQEAKRGRGRPKKIVDDNEFVSLEKIINSEGDGLQTVIGKLAELERMSAATNDKVEKLFALKEKKEKKKNTPTYTPNEVDFASKLMMKINGKM